MSLLTPFGYLRDIPLDSIEQLKEMLVQSDKSTLLEGLVIEAVFNEYLGKLSARGIDILPVALVRTLTVKKRPKKKYVNCWWVWDHSEAGQAAAELCSVLAPSPGQDEFLFDCYYDELNRDFFIKRWRDQTVIPIQSFMQEKRRMSALQFKRPTNSVIDENRSLQAFWAGIPSLCSDDLFKHVVLHRLFKNCAIQPFFDGVWDIDSLARLSDESLIQLEVKHKYPHMERPSGRLSFGINVGQLYVMQDLERRGIKTLHMILVKPIWEPKVGLGALLNRIGDRKNVLLLAKLMDAGALREIRSRRSWQTGVEQSFTGEDEQKVHYVGASEFQLLGTLDDPVEMVAGNIALAATGALNQPVTDQLLIDNRIQP